MDTPPAVSGSVAVDGLALQRLMGTTATPAPWQERGLLLATAPALRLGLTWRALKSSRVTGAVD